MAAVIDEGPWASVEWNWQGEDEVLGRKAVLVQLRPLQTTYTGLSSNPGPRGESQDTVDPFLRRAYTHILSHVRLCRVVMLYEDKLQTYIRTLWHFFFWNYHRRSGRRQVAYIMEIFTARWLSPVKCRYPVMIQTSLLLRPLIDVRELMFCSIFRRLDFGRHTD